LAGILMVLAHPDDESFLGGGTLASYARRGIPTAPLTLNDGQAGRLGVQGQPPLATRETLGAVRREELRRAAAVLGIAELMTPGWWDGELDQVPDAEGTALVTRHVRRLRPEILITFGPEGAGSGHADHKAACRWATSAFDLAADPTYEDGERPHAAAKCYWITWPRSLDALRGISGAPITTVIEIGEDLNRLKRKAFAEHRTQQDHLQLFNQVLDLFGGKEYFHLARSRVGFSGSPENDLYERVET